MNKISLMVPNFLPKKEYFAPEKNNACPGCGLSLAVRQVYKTIEGAINDGEYELSGDNTLFKIKKNNGELVIFLDNEAGAALKETLQKSSVADAIKKGCAYAATASPSYPFDLIEKVKKAMDADGDSYIHILTPCPPAWQFDTEYTVKLGYWAVESRAFPLYEIENGSYSITVDVPKPRDVSYYLQAQQRYGDLSESDLNEAQALVDGEYKKLIDKAT